jgi:hypothetical protein
MVKDGITVMTDVSVEISRELGKLIQFTTQEEIQAESDESI